MPRRDGGRGVAADLAQRLAQDVDAVCRHYLPNGRREGRYWLTGDAMDTPGRSLFVRLAGPDHGPGAAGKWSDAATGEHGDLLDLIAANRRCPTLREALAEARAFLALPPPDVPVVAHREAVAPGSTAAARRLWALAQPLGGSTAATYLRHRGITHWPASATLRAHPRCWYRPNQDDAPETPPSWPALIAAIRDPRGVLTGVHRTWLCPAGAGKAPVATPRRAMGAVLGGGIWFGQPGAVMTAGEGIETVLSLRQILPALPMVAATSAGHLAALSLPPGLRRLYIAQDDDPAGRRAVETLRTRARDAGIEAIALTPRLGDFNDDLVRFGPDGMRVQLRAQLAPDEAALLADG